MKSHSCRSVLFALTLCLLTACGKGSQNSGAPTTPGATTQATPQRLSIEEIAAGKAASDANTISIANLPSGRFAIARIRETIRNEISGEFVDATYTHSVSQVGVIADSDRISVSETRSERAPGALSLPLGYQLSLAFPAPAKIAIDTSGGRRFRPQSVYYESHFSSSSDSQPRKNLVGDLARTSDIFGIFQAPNEVDPRRRASRGAARSTSTHPYYAGDVSGLALKRVAGYVTYNSAFDALTFITFFEKPMLGAAVPGTNSLIRVQFEYVRQVEAPRRPNEISKTSFNDGLVDDCQRITGLVTFANKSENILGVTLGSVGGTLSGKMNVVTAVPAFSRALASGEIDLKAGMASLQQSPQNSPDGTLEVRWDQTTQTLQGRLRLSPLRSVQENMAHQGACVESIELGLRFLQVAGSAQPKLSGRATLYLHDIAAPVVLNY